MKKIYKIIEETPSIVEIQKDFYKVMISERKEKILDYSMDLLMKQEMNMSKKENYIQSDQQIKM